MLSIFLIAIGLSMDSFAVSITSGLAVKKMHIRHALTMGGFFGGFQALMPVLGWFAGLSLRRFIESYDHWVAFALLGFIGGKMIWEAFKVEEEEKKTDFFSLKMLFILSIATSIDAFAVGLTLSFLKIFILAPAIIIGCTTFAISFAGVYIGDMVGHFFEKKIEIFGGLILIGIGTKILIEHLMK
jgi:putative Mn2+ efflux pump MntP